MNRKRLIFLVIALVIITLIVIPRAQAILSPDQPDTYSLHRVKAGETLWGLSECYMPDIDPRVGVEWIDEINGFQGYVIQPGDIITVPDPDGELAEPLGPRYTTKEAARAAEAAFQRVIKENQEAASRGAKFRELTMESTAFTAGLESTGKAPGHPEYGIMFSGLEADRGAVAVDPAVIPLGSVVWVEGYGYAVCLDTGADIKGERIDVFIADLERARAWGRQIVKVRVLE
jgi:3D (Asp-Asp-Asp) domain-containing protein